VKGVLAFAVLALLLAPDPLPTGRGPDPLGPPPGPAADSFSASSGGPIVLLSRIYPNAARDDEFVEVVSLATEAIDLGGWALTDLEDAARFPEGLWIAPGARVVATRNATSYEEDVLEPADLTYDRGDGARMEGQALRLADTGDEVLLLDPTGAVVDAFVYGDAAYAGPGWSGPPAPAPGRGEIAVRRSERTGSADQDRAEDWQSLRPYRLGQSAFAPPALDLAKEPLAVLSPDDGDGPILAFLSSAERSLEVAVYTLTSERIASVLAERARQGVRVRVLLEGSPVGGLPEGEPRLVDGLLTAGAEVRFLRSGPDVVKRYRYLHAKYALADGQALFVSSENFGDAGFPPTGDEGNRGWSVIVEDLALAGQLWEVFEEDFDPRRRDSVPAMAQGAVELAPPPPVAAWRPRPTTCCPRAQLLVGPDNVFSSDGLLGLLASAVERIYVEAFYVADVWDDGPNPFLEALFAAARRGVVVRILLDGSAWSVDPDRDGNDDVAMRVNERAAREGADLVVRLLEPGGRIQRLHNKGLVVDGRAVLVSSLNGVRVSATEDREIGLLLWDEDVASAFEASFLEDWGGGSTGTETFELRDPVALAGAYAFVVGSSLASLHVLRRRRKGLKHRHRMERRGPRRPHLRRGPGEVRLLPPELVAEPRPRAGGRGGDRRRREEARSGLGGPEGDTGPRGPRP